MIIIQRPERYVDELRRNLKLRRNMVPGVATGNELPEIGGGVAVLSPDDYYLALGKVVSVNKRAFVAQITKYFM